MQLQKRRAAKKANSKSVMGGNGAAGEDSRPRGMHMTDAMLACICEIQDESIGMFDDAYMLQPCPLN